MRTSRYVLVDVFTEEPFGGNQLAVFVDGSEVPERSMQKIARELNLSETTFVLPPDDPSHLCRVRIFTPLQELPMAGHPTVGTAYVLATEGRIEPPASVVFEQGVGPIPVEVGGESGSPRRVVMQQPLPEFGPTFPAPGRIAEMLGLEPTDLAPELPVEVVSCGLPFLYVPLAGPAAVRRARLRMDLWEELLGGFATQHVYLFSLRAAASEATVQARMFAPAVGVAEDPATGSASGPLGCYLVRHGLLAGNRVSLRCEQGVEIGRPSLLEVEISSAGDAIREVRVGGRCATMGEGRMRTG